MATLASHGTLKIKNVNAKNITLETNNSANVVELKTHQNSAEYSIVLPAAAPTVKEQALQADITDQTVLNWGNIVNYESGSDVTDPAVNTDNGRFFADTSAETIYFRINDTWKPVNNWLSTTTLGAYSASTETNAVHHETSVDRFYFPSPTSSAWYRLTTTSYHTPNFVNIDSSAVHGGSPKFAGNDNLVIINDGCTMDDSEPIYNNGIIVLRNWVAAYPAYVEWEFITGGFAVTSPLLFVMGIIDKLASQDNAIPANSDGWGVSNIMSKNNGLLINIFSCNAFVIIDNQSTIVTNAFYKTTDSFISVEYGDRIQIFVDPSVARVELVYIKHNAVFFMLKYIKLVPDMADKGYYASIGNTDISVRVSTRPYRYMGTLSPSTYILNYDT